MGHASQTERIDHNLTLHPPTHAKVGAVMDELRAAAKDFSHLIDSRVPDGREKSLALTEVEHACQDAISGVARNQSAVIAAGTVE